MEVQCNINVKYTHNYLQNLKHMILLYLINYLYIIIVFEAFMCRSVNIECEI